MRRLQTSVLAELHHHIATIQACRQCPDMQPSPVTGQAVASNVMLVGQAPGDKEPVMQKPFAWTAGQTLFKWFGDACGIDEETFRSRVYMAAVCRCFPGKKPKGGDRVPNAAEIATCSRWLQAEMALPRRLGAQQRLTGARHRLAKRRPGAKRRRRGDRKGVEKGFWNAYPLSSACVADLLWPLRDALLALSVAAILVAGAWRSARAIVATIPAARLLTLLVLLRPPGDTAERALGARAVGLGGVLSCAWRTWREQQSTHRCDFLKAVPWYNERLFCTA